MEERRIYCGDTRLAAMLVRKIRGKWEIFVLSGVTKGGRGVYKDRLRPVEDRYDAVEWVDTRSGRMLIRLLRDGSWSEVVLFEHQKRPDLELKSLRMWWEWTLGKPKYIRLRFGVSNENRFESFSSMLSRGVADNATVLIDLIMIESYYYLCYSLDHARHLVSLLSGFLSMGSDINVRDERGYTALILSVRSCYHWDLLPFLLSRGADINIRDAAGLSALRHACRALNVDGVRYLLDRGAEVDSVCLLDVLERRDSVVESDEMYDQRVILELLLSYAPDLDVNIRTDIHKETLLMLVVCYYAVGARFSSCFIENQLSLVRLLIESGVSIDARDHYGNTALLKVVSSKRKRQLTMYLLDSGASVLYRNHAGSNALSYATHAGLRSIVLRIQRIERHLGIPSLRTSALHASASRGVVKLQTLSDLESLIRKVYLLHSGGMPASRIARAFSLPVSEVESYLSGTF